MKRCIEEVVVRRDDDTGELLYAHMQIRPTWLWMAKLLWAALLAEDGRVRLVLRISDK